MLQPTKQEDSADSSIAPSSESVQSTTTKEENSSPPRISRRPSAVMEAMAKAQQEELLKLRAALDKETRQAKEQSESFQEDLSRMLKRVADKESELQAAKAAPPPQGFSQHASPMHYAAAHGALRERQ